ncbi:Sodium/iodide cotransporter [Mactra antiquata]
MKLQDKPEFTTVDYVVFVGTLAISFGIGVFFAILERSKSTPDDYFLAGRKSSTIPVALSFIVTFQSSLLIIGVPAESFVYGMKTAYYILGILAAYLFAGFFVVPVFHPLKLTSVYEYFNLRYGNNVLRYLTLATGIMYSVFYMGTVTYATCVALDVVMGIPFWGTIIIYTSITTVYTSIGGIKAVIWTDVFQLCIMVTGILALLIQITVSVGGVDQIYEYAADRFHIVDFRLDPRIRYQFWNTSFGSFSLMLICTYMQPAMQRVYSTPNVKSARTLYIISAPVFATVFALATLEGPYIFAYFTSKKCDIVESGIIENINEILPFTIVDIFKDNPGFSGLFIAALSSAALSTLSSCLSSLSAVTYEDIIKVKFAHIPAKRATNISKVLVLAYGLVAMVLAMAIASVSGSVHAIFAGFMGCLDGPTCSVFLLSTSWRRSTTKGLLGGFLVGFTISLWLNIGATFTDIPAYPYLSPGPTTNCSVYLGGTEFVNTTMQYVISSGEANVTTMPLLDDVSTSLEPSESSTSFLKSMYSISFILFSFIGFASSTLFGIIFSLITKPQKNIDERCLFSFKRHFIQEFFPEKLKANKNDVNEDEEEMKSFVNS